MNNEQVSRSTNRPSGGQELARRLTTSFGGISRPLAGRRWFRLWGVLHHVGRTSGRAYATPLVTRRVDDGFVIPLPFGEGTQWVRNLIAAGAGTIRWDGRDFEIVRPRIVELEEVPGAFGGLSRAVIRRAGARFVRVDDAGDAGQHLAGQGRAD